MLEKLPREILRVIGECLDEVHSHSVVNLAFASRHCFSVLAAILFRTLKFSVNDSGQLAEDIRRYSQLLQHVNGYGNVRRLIIKNNNRDVAIWESNLLTQQQQQQQWHRPRMSTLEYRGCGEDILEKYVHNWGHEADGSALDTVYQTNHLWQPLSDFIQQLHKLETLFYDSYFQFPPCLLDSLHKYQPQCKLYITHFNLWSLNSQGTADKYEFAVVSSPCLYGIGTRFREERLYLFQALMCLISGITPSLKTFLMLRYPPPATLDPVIVPLWGDFTYQLNGHSKSCGSLNSFQIYDSCFYDREYIESLERVTNLSELKVLRVSNRLRKDVISFLVERRLPSLIDLELNLLQHERWPESDYISAVNSFLLDLPALSSLKLRGWVPEIATDLIFSKHGSHLRHLSLMSKCGEILSLENLYHMAESCRFLEKLTIQIKRSRGDYQEVLRYKTLGLLPRLQHLYLELDASDYSVLWEEEDDDDEDKVIESPNDPSFNEFDQQYCMFNFHYYRYPRNGHIRDAFINGALDHNLAYDIFQTICSSRSPPQNNNSFMLEFMEVEATGAGRLSYHGGGGLANGVQDVLDYLGHTVRVDRTYNKNGDVEIKVNKLEIPREKSYSGNKRLIPLPFMQEIFNRVWPAKNNNWREDWHSFPLAMSVEDEIDWKSR